MLELINIITLHLLGYDVIIAWGEFRCLFSAILYLHHEVEVIYNYKTLCCMNLSIY